MTAVIAGLRDWLGRVDPAQVADRLRARAWAQVRPEPVAPLAQSTAAAALTDDAVLRLRRRLRCALRDGADGGVTLLAGRRIALGFPAAARAALAALLAAGELKVGDLPGLEPAARLDLARRLVTESIATVPDEWRRVGTGSGRIDEPCAGPGGGRERPLPPPRTARPRPLLGARAGARRLPRRHGTPRPALAADRAAGPVGTRRARRVPLRPERGARAGAAVASGERAPAAGAASRTSGWPTPAAAGPTPTAGPGGRGCGGRCAPPMPTC